MCNKLKSQVNHELWRWSCIFFKLHILTTFRLWLESKFIKIKKTKIYISINLYCFFSYLIRIC